MWVVFYSCLWSFILTCGNLGANPILRGDRSVSSTAYHRLSVSSVFQCCWTYWCFHTCQRHKRISDIGSRQARIPAPRNNINEQIYSVTAMENKDNEPSGSFPLGILKDYYSGYNKHAYPQKHASPAWWNRCPEGHYCLEIEPTPVSSFVHPTNKA